MFARMSQDKRCDIPNLKVLKTKINDSKDKLSNKIETENSHTKSHRLLYIILNNCIISFLILLIQFKKNI